MMENNDTQVVYLRGNHDDFLDQILPMQFGKLSIVRDHVHESFGKKYYVTHGDVFDSVTTNLKWIAKLGDVGYTFLLWLNKHYNNYRVKRGLPYYSLSQAVKQKVKSAVSYISDFEEQLVCLAKIKKCDGIICGHIHQPAIKQMGSMVYMNSGDWVESLSTLVETKEGEWQLIFHNETLLEDQIMDEDDQEEVISMVEDIVSLKKEVAFMKKMAM